MAFCPFFLSCVWPLNLVTKGMAATTPTFDYEYAAQQRGFLRIAGLDEVGRGPLAGPVVAAAAVLDPDNIPDGLNDSKKLSAKRRDVLFDELMDCADISIAEASVAEIDEHNILRASHIAMVRALGGLKSPAEFVLIDGNMIPRGLNTPSATLVKGDAKSLSIAAASIVAKVWRDRLMVDLAQQHPGYGWERNAGYPTKEHKAGLKSHGVTPHHRRSFAPVHNILYQDKIVTD
ncbi:RNase HII [Cognatiyoonia sediminum]|uniref:Ribonuclease HII n=2 Tax=Cognatiyoonia sediminum TaxID=1508389 RepID=A0A1M5RA97_9RHOB|nr:RNase HII [Cognatiyoonia sediminum]